MRFVDVKAEYATLTNTFNGKWKVTDSKQQEDQILWLNEELKATITKHEKVWSMAPRIQFSYHDADDIEIFKKQSVIFNCGIVAFVISKDITENVPTKYRRLFQGLRLSVFPTKRNSKDDSDRFDIEADCPDELILFIELIIRSVKLGAETMTHNLKKWIKANEDDS